MGLPVGAGQDAEIHVPFHTANRTGKAYFEELVWSELGDYVRQILRDGRRGEET